ncbi:hypothetical protein BCR35DRAFT_351571 [Leucosporidium creatinivorum]|uniref:OTU domain-containing protein n=1 Tax=Leucosporidium creatinivorum TaxID=106004 RepID=A0A1Y2FS61_9BASI|nr:hypothetical protein BCR35DRAFT_351571 [Leucosporidium creatinivorum]
MARKGGKNDFARPRARSKTRSNKPKLIEDPQEEERLLKAQLSSAGLYAANTLGDGNCLFRALSDQLTGSDGSHASIRHEVCQHLASHADRYRLFVDSDSVPGGYEGHVGSMRRLGTYGTNIELSAFANLYQRSIKVVQPGLTYVITPEPMEGVVSPDQQEDEPEEEPLQENLTPRELRLRKRHAKLKAEKGKGKQTSRAARATGTLYIVYHSWEHYSSIRRLAGPHSGLPNVEPPSLTPLGDEDSTSIPSTPDEPPPPLRRIRGRPKKPATSSSSLLAQSIALPPSGPPSPASTPPPSTDHLEIPHSSSPRHRARSASTSSVSGDDSHHNRKIRSRRQSPATSDAPSPATSNDAEDHTDEEEEDEPEARETRSSKKAHPLPKARRGPTAREKKEIARRRKVELRKARAGTSAAEKARSSRATAGEENVLMEVKELFI